MSPTAVSSSTSAKTTPPMVRPLLPLSWELMSLTPNLPCHTHTAVASMPNIWVTPTSDNADDFSGSQFTLMLADASAVGGPDPEGDFRVRSQAFVCLSVCPLAR